MIKKITLLNALFVCFIILNTQTYAANQDEGNQEDYNYALSLDVKQVKFPQKQEVLTKLYSAQRYWNVLKKQVTIKKMDITRKIQILQQFKTKVQNVGTLVRQLEQYFLRYNEVLTTDKDQDAFVQIKQNGQYIIQTFNQQSNQNQNSKLKNFNKQKQILMEQQRNVCPSAVSQINEQLQKSCEHVTQLSAQFNNLIQSKQIRYIHGSGQQSNSNKLSKYCYDPKIKNLIRFFYQKRQYQNKIYPSRQDVCDLYSVDVGFNSLIEQIDITIRSSKVTIETTIINYSELEIINQKIQYVINIRAEFKYIRKSLLTDQLFINKIDFNINQTQVVSNQDDIFSEEKSESYGINVIMRWKSYAPKDAFTNFYNLFFRVATDPTNTNTQDLSDDDFQIGQRDFAAYYGPSTITTVFGGVKNGKINNQFADFKIKQREFEDRFLLCYFFYNFYEKKASFIVKINEKEDGIYAMEINNIVLPRPKDNLYIYIGNDQNHAWNGEIFNVEACFNCYATNFNDAFNKYFPILDRTIKFERLINNQADYTKITPNIQNFVASNYEHFDGLENYDGVSWGVYGKITPTNTWGESLKNISNQEIQLFRWGKNEIRMNYNGQIMIDTNKQSLKFVTYDAFRVIQNANNFDISPLFNSYSSCSSPLYFYFGVSTQMYLKSIQENYGKYYLDEGFVYFYSECGIRKTIKQILGLKNFSPGKDIFVHFGKDKYYSIDSDLNNFSYDNSLKNQIYFQFGSFDQSNDGTVYKKAYYNKNDDIQSIIDESIKTTQNNYSDYKQQQINQKIQNDQSQQNGGYSPGN